MKCRKPLKIFGYDVGGAAAVEAALVFPVLFFIVLGAIDFSFALYTYNTMQASSASVARRLSANDIAVSDAPALIKAELPAWAASAATASITLNSTLSSLTVVTTVPATSASPVKFFLSSFGSGLTLQVNVTMRQEAKI